MFKKLALAVMFVSLGAVTALAADFNGKWTAQVQGRNGPQTITFDFHVDGSTLTGKVTTTRGDTDISNGKVDGDNISFDQTMNFNDNTFTIKYTGKADGADAIDFSRQFGDRPAMTFTAKRGDTAPAAPAQ